MTAVCPPFFLCDGTQASVLCLFYYRWEMVQSNELHYDFICITELLTPPMGIISCRFRCA